MDEPTPNSGADRPSMPNVGAGGWPGNDIGPAFGERAANSEVADPMGKAVADWVANVDAASPAAEMLMADDAWPVAR